jgi:3-hydroxymyristoyl/3-hydroxydecanoyl-(acyl carrier protein) dehydratase
MMRSGEREANVPASHPALPGHFPDAPIVPAAWQLTLVEGVCRDVLGADIRVAGLASARFRAPWRPDARVTITVFETSPSRVRFVVEAPDVRLADGVLVVERGEAAP